MTHTLHRRGARAALATDWVVIAMAARRGGPPDAAERLRDFLRLALARRPVNWGDMRQGGRFGIPTADLIAGLDARSLVHAVFTDVGRVADLLADLRRADLGLSVVVSGLLDGAANACREAGLDPGRATVQLSLGSWCRRGGLPADDVLETVTMCGHGLVSAALVESTAAAVAAGRMSADEGARRLATPCSCGVFNPERAAALLVRMATDRRGAV